MIFNIFGKEIQVKKEILIVAAAMTFIAAGAIGLLISRAQEQVIFDKTLEQAKDAKSIAVENKKDETGDYTAVKEETELNQEVGGAGYVKDDEIKVYVVGCVKMQGIVLLKKGQIIDDAIKAAGGATSDADMENINLVYRLTDNVMLKIKSKNSNQSAVKSNAISKNSINSKNITVAKNDEAGKGIEIVKDSGGTVVNENNEGGKSNGKININTASIDDLDTLYGIGKETAKDIIAFREKNGGFKTINDIMKISGIKQSRFNKIKDSIVVN